MLICSTVQQSLSAALDLDQFPFLVCCRRLICQMKPSQGQLFYLLYVSMWPSFWWFCLIKHHCFEQLCLTKSVFTCVCMKIHIVTDISYFAFQNWLIFYNLRIEILWHQSDKKEWCHFVRWNPGASYNFGVQGTTLIY